MENWSSVIVKREMNSGVPYLRKHTLSTIFQTYFQINKFSFDYVWRAGDMRKQSTLSLR